MITKDQISVGTEFLLMKSTYIVDAIKDYKGFMMVETSQVGGPKDNYRTELNALVDFLNEENATLVENTKNK